MNAIYPIGLILKKMKKKVFVLGGSGYLGQYLLKSLLEKGYEISALVHKKVPDVDLSSLKIYRASLPDFHWDELNEEIPDIIFHSARMGGHDKVSRLAAARQNAAANQKMLEWLKRLEKPPLLVYVSGTLVYGSHARDAIDESTPIAPISFQREYSLAELPVLKAMQSTALPIMVVRPAWIFGPGSWFDAFYVNFMQSKKRVPVYGRGDNLMSFVHVEDAASMIIYAAERGSAGSVYNIFRPGAKSQMEFANTISRISGLPIKHIPGWYLGLRYGKAVKEAFEFSLQVDTLHNAFWLNFPVKHPEVDQWLEDYLD